jgi:hypothetical protein
MIPRDTTPEAWAVILAVLRRLTGAQKVAIAIEMSEFVRDLALAGLRREHPDWPDKEIRLALMRRWYAGCSLPDALP